MIEISTPIPLSKFDSRPYLCPYCRRPNYLSEDFYDEYLGNDYECYYCKKTYPKALLLKDVEFDADASYEWVIRIEFKQSKSKFFNKAKNIAKLLPNFTNESGKIFCGTKQIDEYCQYSRYFDDLCELIAKWKEAKIFFFDRLKEYGSDSRSFLSRVKSLAGEYNILLNRYCNEEVTFEKLPLPYVFYPPLYGAFFAFSDNLHSDIYFCECAREAIENYIKILQVAPIRNNPSRERSLFPQVIYKGIQSHANLDIKYKPKLCFKCNKIVPQLRYCHPMYGGEFEQKYGWYIQQEYLRNGMDPSRRELGTVLQDKCAEYLKKSAETEKTLMRLTKADPEYEALSIELEQTGSVYSLLNDKVRTDFGFRGVGEHWINETTLKHIVESLFPDKIVLAHYRPDWLEGLELDIYVPDIKLGFEYQGIQHFQPIKHWGGKEKLKIQKEHDARKKRLCDELGISLIYFDYTEDITTEYVKGKIQEFL